MLKLTSLYLIISSFLVLIISSCSTLDVAKGYNSVPIEMPVVEVPYFSKMETDYVYKANITVYGNELSGIFIAKKINETTHRIVFTTEFGNKLLDFEISQQDFKINYIVDELDKKMLINTLKTDFRLLLKDKYVVKKQYSNDLENIYQSDDTKMNNYVFISKSVNKTIKIVNATKRKERINLIFNSENNIFATKIIIKHNNIKLRIEFNHISSQIN